MDESVSIPHVFFTHIVALPWFPLWLKTSQNYERWLWRLGETLVTIRGIAGREMWSDEGVFGK